MKAIQCPDCGAAMILRTTTKFTRKDGTARQFYGCSNFPECTTCHGAHPDGTPLGIPGDKATRAARMLAHIAFDTLWQGRKWKRKGAYVWLSRKLSIHFDDCHIALFDIRMCAQVIQVCEASTERDLHRGVPLGAKHPVPIADLSGPNMAHGS